jgi:hypothetical protein
MLPTSTDILARHEQFLTAVSTEPQTTAWHWIETNHRFNQLLWAEEDLARRTRASDAEIAANKRAIDKYNQARNDAIERMDEIILVALNLADQTNIKLGSRLNSETAGSIIDRLSIVSLKVRAMREQTQRTDVDAGHITAAQQKLAQLQRQRADLAQCFDALIADCSVGSAHYRIYRQFKMYNDPRYNPVLVAENVAAAKAGV